MRVLLLALITLIQAATATAQGSGLLLTLRSQIHDSIDVNVSYSGNQSGSSTWQYGATWIDSTRPGGSKVTTVVGDSMTCTLFNSPLAPLKEFATFTLDTATGLLRGLRISSDGSGIPMGGISASNDYTLDFGDVPITSASPGQWSVIPGDRIVHLRQHAYISNSLIAPGTMVNGYGSVDRELTDSGFALTIFPAPPASVAVNENLQGLTFANGAFHFAPALVNRSLALYDVNGREEIRYEVMPGTIELSLKKLGKSGFYFARLGAEVIKFVYCR